MHGLSMSELNLESGSNSKTILEIETPALRLMNKSRIKTAEENGGEDDRRLMTDSTMWVTQIICLKFYKTNRNYC